MISIDIKCRTCSTLMYRIWRKEDSPLNNEPIRVKPCTECADKLYESALRVGRRMPTKEEHAPCSIHIQIVPRDFTEVL